MLDNFCERSVTANYLSLYIYIQTYIRPNHAHTKSLTVCCQLDTVRTTKEEEEEEEEEKEEEKKRTD